MKRYRYLSTVIVVAGLAAATSCSDFDDYNTAYSDGVNASADKTLWENIESNEQLSNFARLVKKSGFDRNLNSATYYTVWAPLNDAIDMSRYEQMDSALLLKEFVQNHVAEYNHGASGEIDDRIKTLNHKAYDFKGMGSYTYDGIQVSQANLPGTNGVMHTLNGVAEYYPNAYSYIIEKAEGADSLKNYFLRYQQRYLDTGNSVIGPIVDGKQTYIDSVMVTYNSLFSRLRANLENEDSTYTVLVPSDKAWKARYDAVKAKYRFLDKMVAEGYENNKISTKSHEMKSAYVSDSLTKYSMAQFLVFSNTYGANTKLVSDNPEFAATDSLITTRGSKLSNPAEILAQKTGEVKLSNGKVYMLDSLALNSWETYNSQLDFFPRRYLMRVLSGASSTQTVRFQNSDGSRVERYTMTWVEPNGSSSKPELDIYLPGVLSTKYDFYCVFAPGYDFYGDSIDKRPNKVSFALSYCNAKGALATWNFSADGKSNPKNPEPFYNDPYKLDADGFVIPDTVYLGQFEFPVSYASLNSNDIMPNLKITTKVNVISASEKKKYTRDMRIMDIILKPVEQKKFDRN